MTSESSPKITGTPSTFAGGKIVLRALVRKIWRKHLVCSANVYLTLGFSGAFERVPNTRVLLRPYRTPYGRDAGSIHRTAYTPKNSVQCILSRDGVPFRTNFRNFSLALSVARVRRRSSPKSAPQSAQFFFLYFATRPALF